MPAHSRPIRVYIYIQVPGGHSCHLKNMVSGNFLPDARYHDLRHSYAVAAISSGIDIKTVQGNLGHATAAFTLDVYGHVTDRMKRESADKMEDFIRRVSGD